MEGRTRHMWVQEESNREFYNIMVRVSDSQGPKAKFTNLVPPDTYLCSLHSRRIHILCVLLQSQTLPWITSSKVSSSLFASEVLVTLRKEPTGGIVTWSGWHGCLVLTFGLPWDCAPLSSWTTELLSSASEPLHQMCQGQGGRTFKSSSPVSS